MPRVHTKTKSKRGSRYDCGKCGKQIKPGSEYYEWSFRYGGTRRQLERLRDDARDALGELSL